jgi:hypothetical protein
MFATTKYNNKKKPHGFTSSIPAHKRTSSASIKIAELYCGAHTAKEWIKPMSFENS